jgi:AraC family transcriptional regulator
VKHIYVSHEIIEQTAHQVFEKDIDRVRIDDRVRAEDPIIPLYAKMLESELHGEGLGERLYIDSIRTQLAIHLLRRYANVEFRQPKLGSLSPRLRRMMTEFIDQNLSENITLEDLARLAGLSSYHFSRKFKADLGIAPHAYVPLKLVAAECGFTDQSHLSRVFRKLLGVTPKNFRDSA